MRTKQAAQPTLNAVFRTSASGTEIGQQMHVVAYRIEGITLTRELAPQTV